jgi:tRNA threonylcarbamoyladenosine biosynthesis protein TsaE
MPILDDRSLEFFSRSADQTRRLGMRLGGLLKTGDVVCLSGDLGAGKTTLVQGIAQGWGSMDPVTSPTFILVNLYRRPDKNHFYHLDAYRLEDGSDADELDIQQMEDNGVLVIEWPERINTAISPERLWINLSWQSEEQRNMVFLAQGQHYERLLNDFRQQAFGG